MCSCARVDSLLRPLSSPIPPSCFLLPSFSPSLPLSVNVGVFSGCSFLRMRCRWRLFASSRLCCLQLSPSLFGSFVSFFARVTGVCALAAHVHVCSNFLGSVSRSQSPNIAQRACLWGRSTANMSCSWVSWVSLVEPQLISSALSFFLSVCLSSCKCGW